MTVLYYVWLSLWQVYKNICTAWYYYGRCGRIEGQGDNGTTKGEKNNSHFFLDKWILRTTITVWRDDGTTRERIKNNSRIFLDKWFSRVIITVWRERKFVLIFISGGRSFRHTNGLSVSLLPSNWKTDYYLCPIHEVWAWADIGNITIPWMP